MEMGMRRKKKREKETMETKEDEAKFFDPKSLDHPHRGGNTAGRTWKAAKS